MTLLLLSEAADRRPSWPACTDGCLLAAKTGQRPELCCQNGCWHDWTDRKDERAMRQRYQDPLGPKRSTDLFTKGETS